jgi:tRNA G18 (ribose-2'-O)-methylase SpoU
MRHRIQPIQSLDAPDLAPYRTLKLQEEHRRQGLFVAEGEKVIRRLLESQWEIQSLVIPPDGVEALEPLLEARTSPLSIYVLEKAILETLTGFKFYQGYMAAARIPAPRALESILQDQRHPWLCAAIDGVSNAENIGTLTRTVAAFGGSLFLNGETSASPFLRRAVRSSMGAVFQLPIVESHDLLTDLRRLKAAGVFCLAAHPHAQQRELPRVDLTRDVCIVLGSEGHGISPAVLQECDEATGIPMAHQVDSLNVSCASAAFFYEAARQRGWGETGNSQGFC